MLLVKGMENTRTGASGDHERLVDEEKFSADEILLMDSQDLPYLQTYSAHERKVSSPCSRSPLEL